MPANAEAVFSIQIQSETGVASLSLKGSLSGGSCEIAEVKTEFFDESVKTFKNVAGNSFDVGLSFTDASKPLTNSPLVQLKVKFLTKGKYTLTVDNVTAYDPQTKSRRDLPRHVPDRCDLIKKTGMAWISRTSGGKFHIQRT